jgi:hypothetical protein
VLDRVGLTAEACNCYQLIEVNRHKIMAKKD